MVAITPWLLFEDRVPVDTGDRHFEANAQLYTTSLRSCDGCGSFTLHVGLGWDGVGLNSLSRLWP